MRWTARLGALLLPLALAAPVSAQDTEIDWAPSLVSGMKEAKEFKRLVMVCVNAKHVDGRTEEEPAAKGLREVVYKNPKIVKRSMDFVCVFLKPTGAPADYEILYGMGMSGTITSPQHIFIDPQAPRIVLRKPYWSHGKGEKAVEALLKMMDDAELAAKGEAPKEPGKAAKAPAPGTPERERWISARVERVAAGAEDKDAALVDLAGNDHEGDCVTPLADLMKERKKDADFLVPVIRALGRDGLKTAAVPVSTYLSHRDPKVRGNAAVTLEYIGSDDKKVISALSKLAGKAKEPLVAAHAWRALGRCGTKNKKVRSMLLKAASSSKSDFESYGPYVGLAYFEKDKAAARAVEKQLKQIGIPGGRRGGGRGGIKRGLVSWTLASIGDTGSATFFKEEMLGGLKNVKAFWVDGLRRYWESCQAACMGEEGALEEVTTGVGVFVSFSQGFGGRGGRMTSSDEEPPTLMDECREGRDNSTFKPKGDGILQCD
ncbi:MAG: HEAT repeat domain-containing protein [Planctomycetota bacterium]|jgi:hypothetical protein